MQIASYFPNLPTDIKVDKDIILKVTGASIAGFTVLYLG